MRKAKKKEEAKYKHNLFQEISFDKIMKALLETPPKKKGKNKREQKQSKKKKK